MRRGAFSKLKWVKPKKKAGRAAELAVLAESPSARAMSAAVDEFGVPEPTAEHKKTAQAEAAQLLRAAAEIEHALLVEYLYAAYSINPTGPMKALAGTLAQIAVEEMGHLITVQNLLLALGEAPYMDRENVPLNGKPAGTHPFPLSFEPLSGDSLAKYVTTESLAPTAIRDDVLREKLLAIQKRADTVTGRPVNHVGLLYAKLFWLFQPNDAPHPFWREVATLGFEPGRHIPDKALKGTSDPRQVKPESFSRLPVTPSDPAADNVYVIEVRNRGDALFALDQIAAQGESPEMGVASHFNAFLGAYDQYGSSIPVGGVRPVPVNPHTALKVVNGSSGEAARVTHTTARLWGRLFNLRYELLILELWLGVATEPTVTGPLSAESLFGAAYEEMLTRVRGIARDTLPSLPLKAGGDAATAPAAAPFELPEDPLPGTPFAVKKRLRQLLDESGTVADELEALSGADAVSAADRARLKEMRLADTSLRGALP